MAEKEKNPFGGLKLAAQKGLASIDVDALKEKAAEATGVLKDKAVEVKDAAVAAKDEIADKGYDIRAVVDKFMDFIK